MNRGVGDRKRVFTSWLATTPVFFLFFLLSLFVSALPAEANVYWGVGPPNKNWVDERFAGTKLCTNGANQTTSCQVDTDCTSPETCDYYRPSTKVRVGDEMHFQFFWYDKGVEQKTGGVKLHVCLHGVAHGDNNGGYCDGTLGSQSPSFPGPNQTQTTGLLTSLPSDPNYTDIKYTIQGNEGDDQSFLFARGTCNLAADGHCPALITFWICNDQGTCRNEKGSSAAVGAGIMDIVGNTAPASQNQDVPAFDEDTSTDVQLVANDAEGDPVTYTIATSACQDGPKLGASCTINTDCDIPTDTGHTCSSRVTATGSPTVFKTAHGTVTLVNATTGLVHYVPDPNYNGTDSFQFKASDGVAFGAAAIVRLTINAVNDAPNVESYVIYQNSKGPDDTVTWQTRYLSDPDSDNPVSPIKHIVLGPTTLEVQWSDIDAESPSVQMFMCREPVVSGHPQVPSGPFLLSTGCPTGFPVIASGSAANGANGQTVTATLTPTLLASDNGKDVNFFVTVCDADASQSSRQCQPGSFNQGRFHVDTTYILTIVASGLGTVTSSDGFINCVSVSTTNCSHSYLDGTNITLTAQRDPTTVFGNWTTTVGSNPGSDCTGNNATCGPFPLRADETVTATFAPARILTVVGTGTGKVTGDIPGVDNAINCEFVAGVATTGSTCTATYANGANVVLTPQQTDPTFAFTGFDEAGVACTSPCHASMTAPHTITTSFKKSEQLTIQQDTTTWHGTGQVDVTVVSAPSGGSTAGFTCTSFASCLGAYLDGTVIKAVATPTGSSSFDTWSGVTCATGQPSNTCQFTINAPTTLVVTFRAHYAFTVSASPGGKVNGSGIVNCRDTSGTCTVNILEKSTPTLTATSDVNFLFTTWSGGGCTTANPCTLAPLSGPTTVTATFAASETLTIQQDTTNWHGIGKADVTVVSAPPGGSTSPFTCTTFPCTGTYLDGTVVQLAAAGLSGSTFDSWQVPGGVTCASATCQFTLNASTAASATKVAFKGSFFLTINRNGLGSASTVPASGFSCPSSGTWPCVSPTSYPEGTTVTLQATGDTTPTSYTFTSWTPDAGVPVAGCSTGNCAVPMNSAHTITATFLPRVDINILKTGLGSGKVTVTPTSWPVGAPTQVGGDCGTNANNPQPPQTPQPLPCPMHFIKGTVVNIAVSVDPGFAFGSWTFGPAGAFSPATCSGTITNPCNGVTLNGVNGLGTVTVDFQAVTPPTTVITDCPSDIRENITNATAKSLGCDTSSGTFTGRAKPETFTLGANDPETPSGPFNFAVHFRDVTSATDFINGNLCANATTFPCGGSTAQYTTPAALNDGDTYLLEVTAIDSTPGAPNGPGPQPGNKLSFTWTKQVNTPPTVVLTNTFLGLVGGINTAKFDFVGTDSPPDNQLTFACTIDTGAPFACSGPLDSGVAKTNWTYSGFGSGNHVVTVKATDALGATGVPDSFPWNVPVASIVGGPTQGSQIIVDPSTFTFNADDGSDTNAAGVSYQCQIDNTTTNTTVFPKQNCGTAVTSPYAVSWTTPTLGTGSYKLIVWATDATNFVSGSVTRDWSITNVLLTQIDANARGGVDIAVRNDGSVIMSYYTSNALKIAECAAGDIYCASPTFTVIDTTATAGTATKVVLNGGNPSITYTSTNGGNSLRYASYVGTGGSGCAGTIPASAAAAWKCEIVSKTAVASHTLIFGGPSATTPIVFFIQGTAVEEANIIGAPGAPAGTACALSATWQCRVITTGGFSAAGLSAGLGSSNQPRVTFTETPGFPVYIYSQYNCVDQYCLIGNAVRHVTDGLNNSSAPVGASTSYVYDAGTDRTLTSGSNGGTGYFGIIYGTSTAGNLTVLGPIDLSAPPDVSMVVDPATAGRVEGIYQGPNNTLQFFNCASPACNPAQVTTRVLDTTRIPVPDLSMALDTSVGPHVPDFAYMKSGLTFGRCKNQFCN